MTLQEFLDAAHRRALSTRVICINDATLPQGVRAAIFTEFAFGFPSSPITMLTPSS
jgi:hypothetical protein